LPPVRRASREVEAPRSFVSDTSRGVLGSPLSLARACFHARRKWSRPHRHLPASVTRRDHLSSALLLLRVPSRFRPDRAFRPDRHLPRFRSSSRHHETAATIYARGPNSALPPSSGFRNLSTVCSAVSLAGLFHPAATSRISLVQGLLTPRSHPASSAGACPLAVPFCVLARLAPAATTQRPFGP